MSDNSPYDELVKKISAAGAEKLAQVIVNALMPAGAQPEWDSETIEMVVGPLDEFVQWSGGHGVDSNHPENTKYWQEIALDQGLWFSGME